MVEMLLKPQAERIENERRHFIFTHVSSLLGAGPKKVVIQYIRSNSSRSTLRLLPRNWHKGRAELHESCSYHGAL